MQFQTQDLSFFGGYVIFVSFNVFNIITQKVIFSLNFHSLQEYSHNNSGNIKKNIKLSRQILAFTMRPTKHNLSSSLIAIQVILMEAKVYLNMYSEVNSGQELVKM